RVIVALGASALRALTGTTMSVESSRGNALEHPSGARLICTYHPSAILRADPAEARRLRESLIHDLRLAGEATGAGGFLPIERDVRLDPKASGIHALPPRAETG